MDHGLEWVTFALLLREVFPLSHCYLDRSEFGIAGIQAYVFTMLFCIYLQEA